METRIRSRLGASAVLDVGVVAALALLLRLPFRAQFLWAWDSVLYARAIERFQLGSAILDQRPHPPGYALYVLMARAAAAIVGDPNAALVALSIAGGIGAVVAAYAMGRVAGGRLGGIAASAVALADPVLWHASGIAYPYAVLGALSGALGGAFWWMRGGPVARVVVASVAFGLAAGVRQDLLLYVGPLWLVALAPRGRRAVAAGAAALAVASCAWIVPSAIAAGGLGSYAALVSSQALYASGIDDRAHAVSRNALLAANGLWWQLLWLWPLALIGAWWLRRSHRRLALHLAAWLAPGLVSFVAFHTGEPEYTLVVVVPLAVLVGAAVATAVALPRRPLALAAASTCAVLIVLLGSTFAYGHGRYSAPAIARHDLVLARQISLIRSRFDPADTVLLAQANYLHAVQYLPEYLSVYVAPRREHASGRKVWRDIREARRAVLFDDSEPKLRTIAQRVVLSGGVDIYVIDVRALRLARGDELDLFE